MNNNPLVEFRKEKKEIETGRNKNTERKNGLNLTVHDDCTGKNENIFLPHFFNCNETDDDVLCVLKKMCGMDSTSFSTFFSSENKNDKDMSNTGKFILTNKSIKFSI